jgi:lactate dehydrogenase-like 2-hydroxyacid dehydrogenase
MSELSSLYTVHRYDLADDKIKFLTEIAPQVTAIATRGDYALGNDIISLLPNLELIASSGAGFDGIDTKAAKARGIAVTNTPGIVSECVADLAMALVLTTIRRTLALDRFVRTGQWLQRKPILTDKVWGERLGIIGLGGIGKAIARRAEAFRMPIAYSGRQNQEGIPYEYFDDPVELARWARILVVAVPGGASTTGLVSRDVIDALGPDGYLINVSRGSVVDEQYLVEALVEARLAGAGLDVFANEPNIPQPLLGLDTVVLQPHVGSGSNYTRVAMGQLLLDNLAAFFCGKPLLSAVS